MVGESGSGKTFYTNILRKKGWNILDSYTTRPPRFSGELGHTFVSQKEFDALRDDFVAYTKFDDYEYATTKKQLETSQFYVIDPAGVAYLIDKVGRDKLIVVYLYAPEYLRFDRMAIERGAEHATKRIVHDKEKFKRFIKNRSYDAWIDTMCDIDLNVRFLERLYRNSNMEG